ncbi:MAG: glycosyltransferase [Gammaproteobacteria bacterium]
MKISIVVPVHNEAENIFPLLTEIEQAMGDAAAYEIIYVDDGSRDATPFELDDALRRHKQLRIIRHRSSCGQSAAIHSGVRAARYPFIATLDGDGQNDPADIPKLYTKLKRHRQQRPNVWMVAGWRQKRRDTGWRRFSSQVANRVRAALLADETPDTGCGLKIFLREAFLTLPYFDHMHRFLPALVLRSGGQVISEPVNHRPRNRGQSKYGTLDRLAVGIVDLLGVMWLKSRAKLPVVEEVTHEQ